MQEIQPYLANVQEMRQSTLEQTLDQVSPDWRQYEGEMMQNLQRYPAMVNDPAMLYRISVPAEVQEARIYRQLLKRQQAKVQGSKVAGSSTTTKQPGAVPEIKSFNDAVNFARADLARRGLKPPG